MQKREININNKTSLFFYKTSIAYSITRVKFFSVFFERVLM